MFFFHGSNKLEPKTNGRYLKKNSGGKRIINNIFTEEKYYKFLQNTSFMYFYIL